jgi:hypothetical protein
MRWLAAAFLLGVLTAPAAHADSCLHSAMFCSRFPSTKIVFVGRVIRVSESGPDQQLAHIAVEEVIRGLQDDLREVDLEHISRVEDILVTGERYIFFEAVPMADRPGVLYTTVCGGGIKLSGNEMLLNAARQMQRNGPRLLVGKIYLRTSPTGFDAEGPAGVTIVAEGAGVKQAVKTGPGGEFEFTSLPVGARYRLSVPSPEFFQDHTAYLSMLDRMADPDHPNTTELAGTACTQVSLNLSLNGKIAGAVVSSRGEPLADVPVQALAVRSGAKRPERKAFRSQKTDVDGRYEIQGLPPGEYIVGINAERGRDEVVYRPVIYPGTGNRDEGSRIPVAKGESRNGINLVLGAPREKATLTVETVFEDGAPSEGGLSIVSVEGPLGFIPVDQTNKSGVKRVEVYRGESYQIHASNQAFRTRDHPPFGVETHEWKGDSESIYMDASEKQVRIVLREVSAGSIAKGTP